MDRPIPDDLGMKELVIRDCHVFLDGEDQGTYTLASGAIWQIHLGAGMLAELRPVTDADMPPR